MPSHLPSSFASAAAGQTRDNARTGGRSDGATRGSGSGEWSRREGRMANGTLTFRRSSTTPFNQSSSHASADTPHTPAVEPQSSNTVPQTPSSDSSAPLQYAKEELLAIFSKISSDPRHSDVTNLLAPGWAPGQVNGTPTRPWGKAGDSNHVAPDPGVCWDFAGTMQPVGLKEMTAEEKELFAKDVNSPLKLPQANNKDGTPAGGPGQNGRKASVSHGSTSGYGVSSPSTASRPGTRRRETTDTNPFPGSAVASPTASRFEGSSWLSRKNTETREPATLDESEEDTSVSREPTTKQQQPFASLNRSNTTGTQGFGASSSIWGSSAAVAPTSGLGAFGSFALPAQSTPDKRLGGTRGESRLAHLIPKDGTDGSSKSGDIANQEANKSWRARPRTDTDPFGGDDRASGSAALGGSHDASPPSHPQGASIFDTPVKGNTGDFGMSGLNLGVDVDASGPASPSETNPYRSPAADRGEGEHDGSAADRSHHAGHGSEQASNFGSVSRAFGNTAFEGSDRSQTSSVGAKGYPLSNLTGWPAGPSAATPDRERQNFSSAFGSSLFSPDLQSPGLGSLGGMFPGPAASNIGATGSLRGSKLGSLFPASMQAQMHSADHDSLSDSIPDLRQSNPLGAIGRGPVPMPPRDTESPLRSGRGVFEDMFSSADQSRLAFTTAEQGLPGLTTTAQGQSFAPVGSGLPPPYSSAHSSEPPTAQARTMVMPDRMRWVYLDPQGQTQGPFSGLEMNDWYKAQFFTPDLRVKKLEDPDFEPLGQLIRRIGNSREPFLVPQIGIPHGPPSQTGPFSPGDSRGVIPPLMGAFPSFGRTLTAEEQNNLERRKQEEQILMARQREFLAHQQAGFGKMQMQPGAPGSLHHHSSAHSLQSQPSFGSITSPLGMAPQAPIGALGPNAGFFESAGSLLQPTPPSGLGSIGSDLLQQDLTPQERQTLASLQAGGGLGSHFLTQPIGAPPSESGLRSQLPSIDQLQHDAQGFGARLKEFEDIRAQRDAEAASQGGLMEARRENMEFEHVKQPATTATQQAMDVIQEVTRTSQSQESKRAAITQAAQQLSLTQQVQNTQAAAAAAAAAASKQQEEAVDAWAKPSTAGLPMPFPPPSNTPLPAPTAQRQKSTLPTQFTTPSPTGTPDTTAEAPAPPPLAPWAPQPGNESQKGPSLKEIQEAEAKKAAKAEEAAAAARRALLEQEAAALREREKVSASVASGLPSTSTWGTGSPVNTPSVSSPWAKPAAVKSAVAGPVASTATAAANERKKTLAEIQREEEARKQKARELAMQQGVATAATMGKRYADLASKTSGPPGLGGPAPSGAVPSSAGAAPVTGNGWATVGAGGKVKAPPGPAATQVRVASVSAVKTASTPVARPVSKPSNAGTTSRDSGSDAMQEFHKWLHRELSRGLSGITDIDAFASNLLALPLDPIILADAVYANSTTMDGNHFGEEFVRRKKLADRGIVEKQPTPAPGDAKNHSSGGWNEVAKKGSGSGVVGAGKDEAAIPGGQFKVVPGRKKGKK